jgi:hypothetical protein
MKAESTAIIDEAPEGGFWAICPEIPGANGQGETKEEAKENLREVISQTRRARLLAKVYEVDPFVCPRMHARAVSVSERPAEVRCRDEVSGSFLGLRPAVRP